MVWPSEIEPGEMRWLYQTERIPATAAMKAPGSEGERPVQRNVEAERAHAVGLVAQALHGQPEGRADQVADAEEDQHRGGQGHVEERDGIGARVADERGQLRRVDAAEARQLGDLGEEVVDEHAERERDHQEVDAHAARGHGAEEQARQRGYQQRRDDRHPRVPGGVEPAVGRHQIGEHHAGDGVETDLAQRDHARVARQEDEARGGDAEPQRLREDDADEVVREDQRREDEEQQRHRRRSATSSRSLSLRRPRRCVKPASRRAPEAAPPAPPRAGRR